MESNYRIAYDKALADLRVVDPMTAAVNADAVYDAATACFTVPFFGRSHHIDVNSGKITDLVRNQPCSVGSGIMIMNYLSWAKDIQPSGRWITLKEVPDGGMVFFSGLSQRGECGFGTYFCR